VGIPYPNPYTPESQARSQYLEQTLVQNGINGDMAKKVAGEWGEDTALRAVNQAIGRAIRHQNDWSAMVLVDVRWEGERVRKKLAGWIGESIRNGSGFGEVVGRLGGFMRQKSLKS
jgi:chromosome transmission fidelity protein 1